MSFNVAIAAGGLGTRMSPLIGDLPKILTPINGIPFLSLVLDRWEELGCSRIHLLLRYGASKIWSVVESWISAQSKGQDMKVSATIEPSTLGVMGALRFARSCLFDKVIFTYGDVFPTVPVKLLLDKLSSQYGGCMAVCSKDVSNESANVSLDGERVTRYEKNGDDMTYIDIGTIAIRTSVLDVLCKDVLNEGNFFKSLTDQRCLLAYKHKFPSQHIGDPKAYSSFVDWFNKQGSTIMGS